MFTALSVRRCRKLSLPPPDADGDAVRPDPKVTGFRRNVRYWPLVARFFVPMLGVGWALLKDVTMCEPGS
jgi:hypothetical protein